MTRHQLCSREREWISRALDGELSEFERTLMTAHLDRCADCRAFHLDLHGFTAALRAAPLSQIEKSVRILPRIRVRRAPAVRVASLAACAAAALFLVVGSLPDPTGGGAGQRTAAGQPADVLSPVNELVISVRRSDLAAGKLAMLPKVPGGIGAVKPPLLASSS